MKFKTLTGAILVVLTTVSAGATAFKATFVSQKDFQATMEKLEGTWKGEVTLGLEVQSLEGEIEIRKAGDAFLLKAKFLRIDGKPFLCFSQPLQQSGGKIIWNQQPTQSSSVSAFANGQTSGFEVSKQEQNGLIESMVFEVQGNRLVFTNASGWGENDLQTRLTFAGKLEKK